MTVAKAAPNTPKPKPGIDVKGTVANINSGSNMTFRTLEKSIRTIGVLASPKHRRMVFTE